MCFNSSSSSAQASETRDERVGADNGSTAFRAVGENVINVSSDDVATTSLEAGLEALRLTTDFAATAFTNVLNSTDRRFDKAEANVASQQQVAADLLKKEQESSDDRLVQLFKLALLAGTAIFVVKSGGLKGVFK